MVQSGKQSPVRLRLVMGAILGATVAALLVAVAAPVQADVFSNPGTITFRDPNNGTICTPPPGLSTPYPSEIVVNGMTGTISDVNVTLNSVTHTFAPDIDILLVGPTGAALVLASDAGGSNPGNVDRVTVTFDDSAASILPTTPVPPGPGNPWGAPNSSITVKPTDYDVGGAVDAFPSPAPGSFSSPTPGGSATLASVFNGSNPNGTWKLYTLDDACAVGDAGSISGWSLNITAAASAAATTTVLSSSPNPSLTGQNVTFTATVTTTAGGAPVTTGTVTFAEGATPLASNVALNGSGQASFSTSTLSEGNHIITATYSGTASFGTSSATVNQRVNNATTVTGNTYCNTGAITIPDVGAATPYPSNIFVTGAANRLGKVTVQLKNVTHPFSEDIDVLLVGPAGQNLVLLSDAGDSPPPTHPTTNVTVTFDDAAANPAPVSGGLGPANSSQTYRPTDYDPGAEVDAFPATAPAPTSATTLATFNGTNPNGTWSLYVVDDATADAGSIAGGWCITLTPQADVSVTKSDTPDPVVAGQDITYTITVANSVAGSTATNVSLSDAIPANTTFVSRVVPGGWSCAAQAAGSTNPLSCTRPSLTPAEGSQSFTLVLKVTAGTTGSITNTATVSADGDTAASGNNVATATTAVNAPQADVSVTKTDSPDPVVAGQNVTYTINVANSVAGSTATNVSLNDPIPANTTFASRVVPAGWSCAAQAAGSTNPLSCTRASLTPADGSQAFALVVRVNNQTPSGASVLNTATVTATEDPNPTGNNVVTAGTAVTFPISKPGVVRSSVNWKLRNSLTSGPPENEFTYGTTPLSPLIGDWDGDGINTAGTFESGTFKLNNANDGSPPDIVFAFGDPRGFPVAGDFNGDGTDDVAVYRNGLWEIRLSNGTVLPSFSFGSGNWPFTVPVAGDWDGDGTDGIGTFAVFAGADPAGTWRLRNTATAGSPDATFVFLPVADSYPVVGDWNGDGIDTVGVKQRSTATWLLSDSNSTPAATITLDFGQNNDLPLVW